MKRLIDTMMDKGRRKLLVEKLRTDRKIADEKVLDAIANIPRHFFIDTVFDAKAYDDIAIQIDAEQTISQPYTVAFQTQLLNLQRTDKVLEIGTGSAYQATVLAYLGVQVYSIERQKKLYVNNKDYPFKKQYPNLKFFLGDGFLGLPTFAPFDKIIITCGAPMVPPNLITQLKVGGIMVIPVNEGENQRMLKIVKQSDGTFVEEKFELFDFVPMLGGLEKKIIKNPTF